jgi:hypothetical protein
LNGRALLLRRSFCGVLSQSTEPQRRDQQYSDAQHRSREELDRALSFTDPSDRAQPGRNQVARECDPPRRPAARGQEVIRNYLFRIFDKVGVSTRVELALYCFQERPSGSATDAN